VFHTVPCLEVVLGERAVVHPASPAIPCLGATFRGITGVPAPLAYAQKNVRLMNILVEEAGAAIVNLGCDYVAHLTFPVSELKLEEAAQRDIGGKSSPDL
jgi:hypothetical protein